MKIQNKIKLTTGIAISALMSITANARPLVDTTWVTSNLSNPNVVLVDLRKAEDYNFGHIPGAINATYGEFGWRTQVDDVIGMLPPLAEINEKIASLGINDDSHVVVIPYGNNSSDVGSATRVYWTFKVLGHDNVSLLNGGMKAWHSQDTFSLETTANTATTPGNFVGSPNDQLVIDTTNLVARIESSEIQPIDARTDEQWEGKAKHPKARIAGAIPTAQRLPQADLVDPETGKFKSGADILAVATANGWDPANSKPLVTYCNTGHWASTAWFALSEVAQLENITLYDGSMVAWTKNKSNPLINSPSRFDQIVNKLSGS